MSRATHFSYAQARLQCRLGSLPDERSWQRLQASGSFAHLLQNLRASELKGWLEQVGPHSDSHDMERALRRHFHQEVRTVARWVPPAWRAAVEWSAYLPDLPALRMLFAGEAVPPWLRDDPWLREYSADADTMRFQALEDSPYARLLQAWRRGAALDAAWTQHWRRLWPEHHTSATRSLEQLVRLFQELGARLADSSDSRRVLAPFEQRLRFLFRRHIREPVNVFIYLAVIGLYTQRLRGELLRRALFESEERDVA